MKKNIIFALSLILSSVATLNFTSCSDDDDDDANHAPKAVVTDNTNNSQNQNNNAAAHGDVYYSSSVRVSFISDSQTSRPKLVDIVKNYMQTNMQGLAETVTVNSSCTSIRVVAKAGKEADVEAKLKAMGADTSALTEQLKKDLPTLSHFSFSISRNGTDTKLFTFSFTNNVK